MTGAWWSAPVALRFGVGTVADVGAATVPHGRRAVLMTDEHLASSEAVRAVAAALSAAGVRVRRLELPAAEPGPRTIADAVAVLSGGRTDVVVAVGGGAVMDTAKLVVLALRDPAARTALQRLPDRTVVELTTPRVRRDPALVLVPTSHGTGAETSGVASLRTADRKHLVLGPGLWADVAVVDPALGTTLPDAALAAGALETWCRAFAIFAAAPLPGTTPTLVDAYAVAAGRAVVHAADGLQDGPRDLSVHVELAAAASTTALGWTSLGRDPHGARLWQAQNELSAVLGASKAQALPAVLQRYVSTAVLGDSTLGRAGRVARFVEDTLPGEGPAPDRVRAWVAGLGLRPATIGPEDDPAVRRVVERTAEAWVAAGAEPVAAAEDARRMFAADERRN